MKLLISNHSLLIRLIVLPVSQSPSKFFRFTQKFIIGRWTTSLASFRCCLGFSGVSLETLKLRNVFSFSCVFKATMFSLIFKWFWMSFFWQVLEQYVPNLHLPRLQMRKTFPWVFLQCKQQREILFTLSVTSFPTEATSFSFFGFFFCPEVFLNIHFVNVPLNHSKNNGCISKLLLCNFCICEGGLIWLGETQNSYFFVQHQFSMRLNQRSSILMNVDQCKLVWKFWICL